ncbi:BTB/POZ domain-containing protein 6-B-like [Paramacrobiotus metropolitanus]|uniref:BTB/POZ domain-containing protein 6-B-like n=1 Tax=Paramacrobiotus metropolitanus TaxID=2943436 RepID=UPI00244578A8|nr:BTB/POZ domain-containing protein 6-B-like [Paramacrobiotus metropolitanus]
MSGFIARSTEFVRTERQRTVLNDVYVGRQILASDERSDVLFAVGRQLGDVKMFSAHKSMLSRGSTVFNTMFNGSLAESGDTAIDVPEILPEAFSNLLRYIYTGSVGNGLNAENVFETVYCADKYNLPRLENLCLTFIKTDLRADNCLLYLEAVKRCMHDSVARLEESCWEVVDRFTPSVLQSEYFPTVSRETMKLLLQRDTLSADENSIYLAVENWSVAACMRDNLEPSQVNRRAVLGEALYLIRFPLLTDAELVNGPMKSRMLLEPELLDIYQFKYANDKPQLPFPVVHRRGSILRFPKGYAEFVQQEKVFVEMDIGQRLFWYPALVVGMREADIVVSRDKGQTTYNCAPYKVVRAADILQVGQEVKILIKRKYHPAVLVAFWGDFYDVCYRGTQYSKLFTELVVSRDQMTAWKAAGYVSVFYC